jgi:acetyl-CoA carboxylase biotin carboxylase subunit
VFDKILVANRGEIAVRVIRACQEMGIRSVAVYSDADRLSPHVLLAGEAVPIGPPPAAESYLRSEAIIEAALATGAQAVHPGYGFMAESPAFARSVGEAGLVFVGPSAEAIAEMGDKTAARARMIDAGVPIIPGSEAISTADQGVREGDRIGWPVLLKAAAGGGGKGMRVIDSAADLPRALAAASREAGQAFGDSRVYVEKYLADPRHIEIQVLADTHGRVMHLGERECSIQRRHQKLIEEAPSPAVDPGLRIRMGEVAVAAAEAVGYVGAGTVEFLYQGGEFYFLEMNTRIQVEHPVTEFVTGVDLVQEQICVAAGLPLSVEVRPDWPAGHSLECRISGEDPFNGFLPSSGRIRELEVPCGPGVRWDGGIVEHFEVGLHYDPLLGKLIVHAPSRDQAIMRMRRALRELQIQGIRTTQPFHLAVLEEADFKAGNISVRYLEHHPELVDIGDGDWYIRAAAVAATLLEHRARNGARVLVSGTQSGGRTAELSEWRRQFRSID